MIRSRLFPLFRLLGFRPEATLRSIRGALGFRPEGWIRVVMNRETHHWISELRTEQLDVLEISGDFWMKRELEFRSYTSLWYPEFDICAEQTSHSYDLVVAEQVFEHLLWPYRAARNIHSMLRPGGYFLVTTPFLVRVHGCPNDCTRWTEQGMRYFLAECGFDLAEIRTGSWGNARSVRANFSRWVMYHPWLHSLRNNPLLPACVWAIARKSGIGAETGEAAIGPADETMNGSGQSDSPPPANRS